jgi:hypothetical protein
MTKSEKLWVESQEILIKQLELQKENALTNIVLNKLSLSNTKKSLKHEKSILQKFIKNLNP